MKCYLFALALSLPSFSSAYASELFASASDSEDNERDQEKEKEKEHDPSFLGALQRYPDALPTFELSYNRHNQ